MANAKRDQNYVTTLTAVLNTDGETIVNVLANPNTNRLEADDASTGSDNGPSNALRDQNYVPVLMAVSSVDGITPVIVYADADGNLLIDSA